MKICWLCKTEVEDKNYSEHIKQCSYDILCDCLLWEDAKCILGYIDCVKDDCGYFQRWGNVTKA